jgi:GntR family transcriptional regulator
VSRRPKYLEIADDLRSQIADGAYPVGSVLPSTSELVRRYKVSVTVARAAVRQLQAEGVAEGHPGKGVYVQRLPDRDASPPPELLEIKRRVDALAETLEKAIDSLDSRLAAVERTMGRHASG